MTVVYADPAARLVRLAANRVARRPSRVDMARYVADPVAFARDVMGITLTQQEAVVAEAVAGSRRVAVPSGHSVGKGFTAACLVSWWFETRSPSIALTTAPTWASTRDLLWREVSAQRKAALGRLSGSLIAHSDGIPMSVWGDERHWARGYNAEKGEAFQGRHEAEVLIILDEAPGVPGYIWDACDSMLQSADCRMLAIGNPLLNTGRFHDACRDPAWRVIRLSSLDHPNVAAALRGEPTAIPAAVGMAWIEEMVAKHCRVAEPSERDAFEWPPDGGRWLVGDDDFRPRVLGLEPRQSSRAVWSEEWVEAARVRRLNPGGFVDVGVDVARYGSDMTVIIWRRGPCVMGIWHRAKQGVDETAGDVAALVEALETMGIGLGHVAVKVDDSGVGGGVTDLLRPLRERGVVVLGVDAASQAREPSHYPNRRSELWFAAAETAADGELDLTRLSDDDYRLLRADLLAPRWSMDARGRRVVEPKDETRKRLGRSPDDADAFNLCLSPSGIQRALPVPTKSGLEMRGGDGEVPMANPLGGAPGRFARR